MEQIFRRGIDIGNCANVCICCCGNSSSLPWEIDQPLARRTSPEPSEPSVQGSRYSDVQGPLTTGPPKSAPSALQTVSASVPLIAPPSAPQTVPQADSMLQTRYQTEMQQQLKQQVICPVDVI